MSWNKNTLNFSEFQSTVKTLKDLKIECKITKLGEVIGQGLNDENNDPYIIYRLEYADKVMLERMERTQDCDMDDEITSYVFDINEEPKEWVIDIMMHDDDYNCCDNCSCKIKVVIKKESEQLELPLSDVISKEEEDALKELECTCSHCKN